MISVFSRSQNIPTPTPTETAIYYYSITGYYCCDGSTFENLIIKKYTQGINTNKVYSENSNCYFVSSVTIASYDPNAILITTGSWNDCQTCTNNVGPCPTPTPTTTSTPTPSPTNTITPTPTPSPTVVFGTPVFESYQLTAYSPNDTTLIPNICNSNLGNRLYSAVAFDGFLGGRLKYYDIDNNFNLVTETGFTLTTFTNWTPYTAQSFYDDVHNLHIVVYVKNSSTISITKYDLTSSGYTRTFADFSTDSNVTNPSITIAKDLGLVFASKSRYWIYDYVNMTQNYTGLLYHNGTNFQGTNSFYNPNNNLFYVGSQYISYLKITTGGTANTLLTYPSDPNSVIDSYETQQGGVIDTTNNRFYFISQITFPSPTNIKHLSYIDLSTDTFVDRILTFSSVYYLLSVFYDEYNDYLWVTFSNSAPVSSDHNIPSTLRCYNSSTLQIVDEYQLTTYGWVTEIDPYNGYVYVSHQNDNTVGNDVDLSVFSIPNMTTTPLPSCPTPTPTNTITPTITPSPTTTPEPTATETPIPTITPEPTATPNPTGTATPTPTITPEPTSTPNPTGTPTPTATETPIPTITPEPTATPNPTGTPTPTPTFTATPTPTGTLTPTPTFTATPTPTADSDLYIDLDAVSGVFTNSSGTQVTFNGNFNKWSDNSLFGNHAYASSLNASYLRTQPSFYTNTSPAYQTGYFYYESIPTSSALQITGLTLSQSTGYTMFYYGVFGYNQSVNYMVSPYNSDNNNIYGYGKTLRDGNGAFTVYVAGRGHRFNTYYLDGTGGFLTVVYDGTIADDNEKAKFYVSYHYGTNNVQYFNQRVYPSSTFGTIGSSETETLSKMVLGETSTIIGHFKYYTVPLNFEEIQTVYSGVYSQRSLPPIPTPTPTITPTNTLTPTPSPTVEPPFDSANVISLDFTNENNLLNSTGGTPSDGEKFIQVYDDNNRVYISGETQQVNYPAYHPVWKDNLVNGLGGVKFTGFTDNGFIVDNIGGVNGGVTGKTFETIIVMQLDYGNSTGTDFLTTNSWHYLFQINDTGPGGGTRSSSYGNIKFKALTQYTPESSYFSFEVGNGSIDTFTFNKIAGFNVYEPHIYRMACDESYCSITVDNGNAIASWNNNIPYYYTFNQVKINTYGLSYYKQNFTLFEYDIFNTNTNRTSDYVSKYNLYSFKTTNLQSLFLVKDYSATSTQWAPAQQGTPYENNSTMYLYNFSSNNLFVGSGNNSFISFDGTSKYITYLTNQGSQNSTYLNSPHVYTFTFNLNSLDSNQTIFSLSGNTQYVTHLKVNSNNNIEYVLGNNLNSSITMTGSTSLTTGTTYVIFVTESSNTYSVYINNQLECSATYTDYVGGSSGGGFILGARTFDNTGTLTDYLDGGIGTVMFEPQTTYNFAIQENNYLTIKYRYQTH